MSGRRAELVAAWVLATSLEGCAKGSDASGESGAPRPSASSAPASSVVLGAPAATTTKTTTTTTAEWSGAYDAKPGTIAVPDGGEWSGWKFRGDDASTGLGAGTIAVTVDSATGRAQGTSEGPLGALVVSGLQKDGQLSLRFDPKDVHDVSAGFTGFALAPITGSAANGTMRFSAPTGNVIREGTFTMTRK